MKTDTRNKKSGVKLRHSKQSRVILFLLSVLFCLSFSSLVKGQNRDSDPNFKLGKPLLVIDGKIHSYDTLKSINSISIFKIDTLKNRTNKDVYPNLPDYGAIIVTTYSDAILQYQKNISAVSKKYKDYATKQQGRDDSCTYIVNGAILPNDLGKKTEKLYNIKAQQIKDVTITENPWYNGGESRKYLVVINTKQ